MLLSRRRLVTAASAVCMAALAGCSNTGGKSPAPSHTPSPVSPAPSAGGQARIRIKDYEFVRNTLSVRPGAKVTVVNDDEVPHTLTATRAKAFDTGNIGPGKTATFTAPAKAGSYPYFCEIHKYMKGTLTVG